MNLGTANGILATTRREAKRAYRQFLPLRTTSFLSEIFWKELGDRITHIEENRREAFYCNRIFYCRCESGRQYFVKLSDSGQLARYEKEQWCMQKVGRLGVLTTSVVSVARHGSFAVMIQPWLKPDGSFRRHDVLDTEEIYSRVGLAARHLVAVSVSGFGESLLDAHNSWQKYLDDWSAAVLVDDTLIRNFFASEEDRSAVKDAVQEMRCWTATPFLHHGDLRRDNLIVNKDKEVFLVDWGASVGHVEHYSLCHVYCTLGPQEFRAFARGYGLTEDEWHAIRNQESALITTILWWTLFWRVVAGRLDEAQVLRARLTHALRGNP